MRKTHKTMTFLCNKMNNSQDLNFSHHHKIQDYRTKV